MVEYIPTLSILRDLYQQPRTMVRFQNYLKQMLGENEDGEVDVVVPITAANPMGREHCLTAVNSLLAFDAEEVAKQTLNEAALRLPLADLTARVALVVLDDVGGGWTNRYLTEAALRMRRDQRAERANKKRQFVQIPCWASETYTPKRIREEARAALYRHVSIEQNDPPETLQQIMELDGGAYAFGGRQPGLPLTELHYTAEVIDPHLNSRDFPLQFAFLFGDQAAKSVGYTPQGVAAYAGFELALHNALLNV